MKKILYILFLVPVLMLGIPSCTDFLEEDNKAGATAELTYASATGLQGLVSGCYSFTRAWYGKEPSLGLSEMGTDLFYYGYDNKQKSLNSYNLTAVSLNDNVADNACLDQYWELFYCAVDVCNNALKYIPLNKVISESTRNQYLGEVYFLRAFYYLHMVNIWGSIPYNSEPPTDIVTNPTRVPEEEVYSKILADIDLSIAAFQTANYIVKTEGRASLWATRALKARTLLYAASWLGKNGITTNTAYNGKDLYALAKTEAEAVIGSGIASFYPNYADTWSMNNEDIRTNKEAIWGVTYSQDLMTNVNCIPYRYKTSATGGKMEYNSLITRTGATRGGSAMLLMFVSMWNNGASDFGNSGNETFTRVLGESTSYITHYVTKAKVYVAPYYSPYGRGFTRYLPSMYLWNLLEKNRATDQRTEATLLDAYTIAPGLEGSSKNYPNIKDTAIYYCALDGSSPAGLAKQAWAKGRYRIQFKYNGDIPVYTSGDVATAKPTEAAKAKSDVYADARYNSYKIGGWCSFPGIKKFLDNVYNATYPTNDLSYRDAIVFRLAEMYLIKSEAELNTSGSAAALTTLNQLRTVRAKTGKDNTLTGTVDINTILDERAIELCGEQQRWFDLKRTKTLVSRVKAYNAQASGQVKDIHYLRPIPQAQLDAITNKTDGADPKGFWQNPGY
jgi:starch-binding outer membrane protein, SusD/RagB family